MSKVGLFIIFIPVGRRKWGKVETKVDDGEKGGTDGCNIWNMDGPLVKYQDAKDRWRAAAGYGPYCFDADQDQAITAENPRNKSGQKVLGLGRKFYPNLYKIDLPFRSFNVNSEAKQIGAPW